LAEESEPKLRGAEQSVWLKRLEAEHDIVRTALAWCKAEGETERGLRLAAALWLFWSRWGHLNEGRTQLVDLLTHAQTSLSTTLRAKALFAVGYLASFQGDVPSARSWLEQSLVLSRAVGATEITAYALIALGGITDSFQGDTAAACVEQALRIFRELEDQWGCSVALNYLGELAREQGNYGRSAVFHEESLALRRTLGDKAGVGLELICLGNIAQAQGDCQRAAALQQEGLNLCRELVYVLGISWGIESLAGVAAAQGQVIRAVRLLSAAEALRHDVGASLSPADHAAYDDHVAMARAQLDAETFAFAWRAGRALPLDEAIAEAQYVANAAARSGDVVGAVRSTFDPPCYPPSALNPQLAPPMIA
jgi:non-specific serine/threonine protein kinase